MSEYDDKVLDLLLPKLERLNVEATWEYPGALWMTVATGETVVTGNGSWAYGNTPEGNVTYYVTDKLEEELSPEEVARLWESFASFKIGEASGLTHADCLVCGYQTDDGVTLVEWNDVLGECPKCGATHSLWQLADGSEIEYGEEAEQ